jgi:hypothetical protein
MPGPFVRHNNSTIQIDLTQTTLFMDPQNTVMRLLVTAMALLSSPGLQAQMVVENFNGTPTQNEINSFKSFIQSVSPGTGGNLNPANNWAQHKSGQNTRAMVLVYEISGDLGILDRMIEYCDVLLSTRNDLAPSPVGQYVIWTGHVEPVWPNSSTQPIGTGGEQGDPVGHLASCARLILQTPSIWNTNVRTGDPKGYGSTYLARATRFVQEAEHTMDSHILSELLDLTNQNRMYWKSGNPYMTGTVPWNQQVMFTYAFQNLAAAHSILNDNAAKVLRYDAIVRACMDWFFSGEPGTAQPYTDSKGNTAYLWSYRPPTGREDWSHSNLDIQGIYRAYAAGKYGVTDAKMLPLANTFMDVFRRGPNDYAGRVDGTDGTGNSSPTTYVRPGWYVAALFRPADYNTIVSEDLTAGGSTGDVTRFSYFLWIKHKLNAPVTLYQGCNYGGWSVSFSTGSYTLSTMQARGVRNDDASSIKIKSGYTATLYSNDNYTGSSMVLSGNDVCFTDNNFNDRVSSMKINPTGTTQNLLTAEAMVINGSEPNYTLNSYPNPAARGKVTILYTIREPGHVKITVYALNGIELTPLVSEHKHAGTFHVTWDASDIPKGIYVVKMLSGGYNLKITKVVLKE